MFSQSYSHILLNQIWKIYFSNFLYCLQTNKQNIVLVSGQALCASDTISLQSKPLEILQIQIVVSPSDTAHNKNQPDDNRET